MWWNSHQDSLMIIPYRWHVPNMSYLRRARVLMFKCCWWPGSYNSTSEQVSYSPDLPFGQEWWYELTRIRVHETGSLILEQSEYFIHASDINVSTDFISLRQFVTDYLLGHHDSSPAPMDTNNMYRIQENVYFHGQGRMVENNCERGTGQREFVKYKQYW